MKILSWNIKSFVSSVEKRNSWGSDAFLIMTEIMKDYDLIAIYEVSTTQKGKASAGALKDELNKNPARKYKGYLLESSVSGLANDAIAVLYDANMMTVTNTTEARRKNQFTGGRLPVYFDVMPTVSQITYEFCAWHAPKPEDSYLIAQGWQALSKNLINKTAIIMGDLNADFNTIGLTIPSGFETVIPGKKKYSTTLKSKGNQPFSSVKDCLSGNLYDQFIVHQNIQPSDYEVINILAEIEREYFPLKKQFNNDINEIYQFYSSFISDHLPVTLDVPL